MDSTLHDHAAQPFWSCIYGHLRRYRWRLAVAGFTSALVGVAVALQPLMVKFIVDDGINRAGSPRERLQHALLYVGIYLFFSVFRVTVWTVGMKQLLTSVEGLLFELRTTFFRHIQHLCFRFQDRTSSGELFNYLFGTPIISIKTFLQQFCMSVPYQVVSLVVVLFTLSRMNLAMTGITVVMIVAIVLINRRSRRVIREHTSRLMRTESAASRHVADMLRGTRAIKLHAMEQYAAQSFEARMSELFIKGRDLAFQQHIEHIKPELIHYLGMGMVYAMGAFMCIRHDMTVGELFAFIASFGLVMAPISGFMQLNLIKSNAEIGMERINKIIRTRTTTPELPVAERVDLAAQRAAALGGGLPCLEFREVVFRHGDTEVFGGLSCAIRDGSSVALVGASGSGKTTFVNLVLRLYDPQGGQVLLNGADLRHYALGDLRSAFGVVPQDPFLFQSSIRENIKFARPEATDEEIAAAMTKAHVWDFVNQFPKGWETLISENGANLSGGQKQRIAIARAILANPYYYIFDEATSALDNESEERIRQAMAEVMRGHTTIIVAHRLSTIRHVDRVLVFSRGRIVQDDGYDELAECDGPFRDLLKGIK